MTPLEIELFACRSDNFGVLLHDPASGATASIDAPEERAILDALSRRGWRLSHIFTTHHHNDHVEANLALKERFGVEIIGPAREAQRIPAIDRQVDGGDTFDFAGRRVEVILTPGHTLGHICFHLPEAAGCASSCRKPRRPPGSSRASAAATSSSSGIPSLIARNRNCAIAGASWE